nr:hypothetical protein BaRGS_022472 [Batillaria attramentaria]
MVKQEVRPDKTENRVLAFSPCRLFVLAAKVPSRIEHSFHFLDIQALESKKINQLALTVDQKLYTFSTLDPNTEEVNHMITHIGVALKQIFPAFPLERLIVKVEVIPPDRLRVMNDMNQRCGEPGGGGLAGDSQLNYRGRNEILKVMRRNAVIEELNLANTGVKTDFVTKLSTALLSNSGTQLSSLDLSGNLIEDRGMWKQYFASTCSLKALDLSGTRLPPEAVKELLLGVASNRHVKGLELDLSSNELGSAGAQTIAGCIGNITGIGRLDISNNNFDMDLRTLLPEIAKNRELKHLAIGRNFSSVKPKHMWAVLEYVVQVLQEEESGLESLSLADSKLKQDTACVINALGSNTSLREIDLSGNQMGDYGARMLSKALQINTHLHTVVWDKNAITAQGFEDIAEALENELNLAVAAYISDNVIDEVINKLSESHKGPEVMSEDPVYQNQLTMYSDSDELEDSDRKKAGRLEKVAESRSKESSTEHLDELPDLPQVQKLEHLNKARPRRARTHAPKRPVAPERKNWLTKNFSKDKGDKDKKEEKKEEKKG